MGRERGGGGVVKGAKFGGTLGPGVDPRRTDSQWRAVEGPGSPHRSMLGEGEERMGEGGGEYIRSFGFLFCLMVRAQPVGRVCLDTLPSSFMAWLIRM